MKYMPDYPQSHLPDQDFFHKLVSTLYPEQLYDIITKSHKDRAINSNEMKDQLIEIDNSLLNEFQNFTMLPSKSQFYIFKLL